MDSSNLTGVFLAMLGMDNATYNDTFLDGTADVSTPGHVDDESGDIYFLVGMLSVFAVVGTIGNALIIYVFSNMLKQKLTSTVFILTLGGTDFFTCCVTIPSTIVTEYYHNLMYYDIPCKIYAFLMTTTVPYSSFIMVAIGIDRYLCICRPFLHAMNIRRAKILVISMACALFPFGMIISLFYGVYNRTEYSSIECIVQIYNESIDWPFNGSVSHRQTFVNESGYFRNETGLFRNTTCGTPADIVYTGECKANTVIFPFEMFKAFQIIHSSFFVVAIVIVFILYGAILRRVLAQNKTRGGFHPFKDCCNRKPRRGDSRLAPANGDVTNNVEKSEQPGEQTHSLRLKGIRRRGSKKSDKMLIANLKIAGTLFTVTLVFGLAFLPAWLMALQLIHFRIRLFYSYFVYNIANPVIYAFLNPSFREQLKQLFPCFRRKTRSRSTNTCNTTL